MYLALLSNYTEQEMTSREYLDDLDAEEPDDFIISLTAQVCSFLMLLVVVWDYRTT